MHLPQEGNGFGVVVLAMVLVVCTLGNMWLKAPLVAQVLGPVAYAIAFAMSMIAACIGAMILKDESFEDGFLAREPIEVPVDPPNRGVGAPHRR